MVQQNLIISSSREAFELISRNKSLFALLFILQIGFFVAFSTLSYVYLPKILESAKAITDYLSQQRLDDISVASRIIQQKGILGEDPLSISRNFDEMLKYFRLYLVNIFIILIFFTSLSWAITNRMVHKFSFKQLIKSFFKILIVPLFYFGLVFSFFFSILNISFTEPNGMLSAKYTPFLILSIILAYFMFVSLALMRKTELKNIVQKTLAIGIKKIHYVSAAYFINLFLFAFAIFLLYNFIETNLFIFLLSLLVMIFSFAFGRIFLVKVIEKLD